MTTPSEAVRVAVQALVDERRRLVFEALGAASMCWEPRPQGVFKSTLALVIGEKLLTRLAALSLHVGDAAFDVEAMLKACVPGGDHCDPQQVADALRAYLGASASPTALCAPALRASAPIAGAECDEGPKCRDCADFGPICPSSGRPCGERA